jgi:hypothetical protein
LAKCLKTEENKMRMVGEVGLERASLRGRLSSSAAGALASVARQPRFEFGEPLL